jgi:branched-subunit amino acid ABC-type transport system permease component
MVSTAFPLKLRILLSTIPPPIRLPLVVRIRCALLIRKLLATALTPIAIHLVQLTRIRHMFQLSLLISTILQPLILDNLIRLFFTHVRAHTLCSAIEQVLNRALDIPSTPP